MSTIGFDERDGSPCIQNHYNHESDLIKIRSSFRRIDTATSSGFTSTPASTNVTGDEDDYRSRYFVKNPFATPRSVKSVLSFKYNQQIFFIPSLDPLSLSRPHRPPRGASQLPPRRDSHGRRRRHPGRRRGASRPSGA